MRTSKSNALQPRTPSPRATLTNDQGKLLAVDAGLRTGLAVYARNGHLLCYRSHHLGKTSTLRRAAARLIAEFQPLSWLIVEGGGPQADVWIHLAERTGIEVRAVAAERWRAELLHARQQRNGHDAKRAAGDLARRVIAWSEAKNPTSLRHDAAEAILIGLWGLRTVGWLQAFPTELKCSAANNGHT